MAPGPVGGKLYMAEVNLPPLPFDVCSILITRSTPSNQSGASWFAELCNALSNRLDDGSRSFCNSPTTMTSKYWSIRDVQEQERINRSNGSLNPAQSTCRSRRGGRISPSTGKNQGGEAHNVLPDRGVTSRS